MKRNILRIDEGKCTGCGLCIPNCPEGAIAVEEREAESYDVRSVTAARMEVPCCHGLAGIVEDTLRGSGKDIPFREAVIGIRGATR